MRESVLFYRSFYEALKDLDSEQFKESICAIMEYALNEKVIEASGVAKAIFLMAKPQIDANNKRYRNGLRGGRSQEPNDNQTGTKPEPKHNQSITKPEPRHNQSITKQEPNDNQTGTKVEPKEKEKEKDKDKDKDIKNICRYAPAFEELWEAYPRKKEKTKAYKCYKARLGDGFPEDELITAVKRYADQCRKERTEEKYIKLAATFLGPNTPFTDYLDKKGGVSGEGGSKPYSQPTGGDPRFEGFTVDLSGL
ncbi:hypothetical protein J2S20_002378 [Moryella indoligenes]|uniref:DUF6291 domain-containing protein n=1 Tax=Moryella indoligenes TaxID=371674 RepID=A0AAE4AN09_9FIRM|nr:DUF6291 domain-containing protein [Moryella indoligenes]MDQ0153656.1 hypothetical protein [Moryella indoligenes]